MPASDHRLVTRQSLRLEGQDHPHSSFLKGHIGLPVLKLETLSSFLLSLQMAGVYDEPHPIQDKGHLGIMTLVTSRTGSICASPDRLIHTSCLHSMVPEEGLLWY